MPRKQQIYLTATFLYAAFIFYLSSLSNPPSPISYGLMRQVYHWLTKIGLGFLAYPFYIYILFPDKFIHFFLYLGFGLVLNLTIRSYKSGFATSAGLAIVFGSLYAASDEIHQIFTPFRSASILDFFADFLGILAAQLVVFLALRVWGFIRRRS